MHRRDFSKGALAAVAAAAFPLAWAEAWPGRPIKMFISQPAGAGPDSVARMLAEQLSKKWGQPIVVENKPGGQNVIGAQAAARSPADGYNFYFATAAALVSNSFLFKSLSYDPAKDFVPVGMVGKVPFVLSVNSASPIKSMQDLVKFAKANPDKLSIATEGPRSFGGMLLRLASVQLNIRVNPVPYVSVGAAITETVGGQVQALISDVPAASQMIKAGRLRPIAVTTGSAVTGLENVPPLAESIPGFNYSGWLAIVAPTKTPATVIHRFNRDLDAVLRDKAMAARILEIGPITDGAGSPEEMRAFMRKEHERWTTLARLAGIQPE